MGSAEDDAGHSKRARGDTAIAMATLTLALGRFSMPLLTLTSVAEQTTPKYLARGVSGDGMLPACRRVDAAPSSRSETLYNAIQCRKKLHLSRD